MGFSKLLRETGDTHFMPLKSHSVSEEDFKLVLVCQCHLVPAFLNLKLGVADSESLVVRTAVY